MEKEKNRNVKIKLGSLKGLIPSLATPVFIEKKKVTLLPMIMDYSCLYGCGEEK